MSLFFQVPRIFVQGECLGGCSEVKKLFESGKLAEIIEGEWTQSIITAAGQHPFIHVA